MCDQCDGPTGAERKPKDEAGGGISRRVMLGMGVSAAAGFAFSLINCQLQKDPPLAATAKGPGTVPGTTAATQNAATFAAGSPQMSAAPSSQAASASVAQSPPATRAAANLAAEVFPDAAGHPLASAAEAPVIIIPRTDWTKARPDLSHIDLMNGVQRITVHHTAGAIQTDGWRMTANELENIREFHAGTRPGDRNWADIAYHFAVDRAGRVWQARPLAYQGAHARGNNEHNLGIVLLGNFETQAASAAQLTALTNFIGFLRQIYAVPLEQVFTHGELGDTSCPGKFLQEFMTRTRVAWGGQEGVPWKLAKQMPTMPGLSPAAARSSGH
jgi:hypothetical protein